MFVVGHAAWNSQYSLRPAITMGVMSKLVTHRSIPVLIQVISPTGSYLLFRIF